jgi:hypothetical protein
MRSIEDCRAPGGEFLIINSIKNTGKFACTTLYIGGPLVPAGTGVPPLDKPPRGNLLKHSFMHDAGTFSWHPGES